MKSITLIILALALFHPPLPADELDRIPCKPDCPASDWSFPRVHLLTTSYGNFKVQYRQRFACGQTYDVHLDWVIPVGSPATDPMAAHSMALIIDLISIELLKSNPMNFPADDPPCTGLPGTCGVIYRVVLGASCWSRIPHTESACGYQYIGCDDASCCTVTYCVCKLPGTFERYVVRKAESCSTVECSGGKSRIDLFDCSNAVNSTPQYVD